MIPEKCDQCDNYIWNPDFWDALDMCGPCTTGESATLFHELWIPPMLQDVDTEHKLLDYWQDWYKQIYLPATK